MKDCLASVGKLSEERQQNDYGASGVRIVENNHVLCHGNNLGDIIRNQQRDLPGITNEDCIYIGAITEQ